MCFFLYFFIYLFSFDFFFVFLCVAAQERIAKANDLPVLVVVANYRVAFAGCLFVNLNW